MTADMGDYHILAAQFCGVWDDCHAIYSEKRLAGDARMSEPLFNAAIEAATNNLHLWFDDYDQIDKRGAKWITNNYASREFATNDLEHIRCKIVTEGDPLLRVNRKGKVKDPDEDVS